MTYDKVEAELLQQVRELAFTMIRFEEWAREAAARGHFHRVAECDEQRNQARVRRSELMRQIWNARHPSRQVVAVW